MVVSQSSSRTVPWHRESLRSLSSWRFRTANAYSSSWPNGLPGRAISRWSMGLPTVLRRELRPGSLLFRGRHRSHCSSPVSSGRSSNRRQAQPNSVYSELRGFLWGSWPPTRSPDGYFTFSGCRLLCSTLNKHLVKSLSMYLVDSWNISYSYKTNPLAGCYTWYRYLYSKMNHIYWLFIVIIIFDF